MSGPTKAELMEDNEFLRRHVAKVESTRNAAEANAKVLQANYDKMRRKVSNCTRQQELIDSLVEALSIATNKDSTGLD